MAYEKLVVVWIRNIRFMIIPPLEGFCASLDQLGKIFPKETVFDSDCHVGSRRLRALIQNSHSLRHRYVERSGLRASNR